MTNGQQRPSNPRRFAVWRSEERNGRPPTGDYSVCLNIPLDDIREWYEAIASGLITPEADINGVPIIKIWGSGWRGTGAPTANGKNSPVLSGSFQQHKAIWQQQQAPQQAPAMVTPPGEPAPVQAPARQGWGAQQPAQGGGWATQAAPDF